MSSQHQVLQRRSIDCGKLSKDLAKVRANYRRCTLCEARCGVNRYGPTLGVCGNDAEGHIYAAQVSNLEERLISPTFEIFFTGCNLRCRDCHQLRDWPYRLRYNYLTCDEVVSDIQRHQQFLRSVSFLGGNPDQSLAAVLQIVYTLECQGIKLPYVFNSNFMFTEEWAEMLNRHFDVFVPDFKFWSDACAYSLSGFADYAAIVRRNIMCVHSKNPIFIRHMPRMGHWECCTEPILEWVSAQDKKHRLTLALLESFYDDNAGAVRRSKRFALEHGIPTEA